MTLCLLFVQPHSPLLCALKATNAVTRTHTHTRTHGKGHSILLAMHFEFDTLFADISEKRKKERKHGAKSGRRAKTEQQRSLVFCHLFFLACDCASDLSSQSHQRSGVQCEQRKAKEGKEREREREMPLAKIKHVASFTSEVQPHVADHVLNDNKHKTWRGEAGKAQHAIVLQACR